MEQLLDTNTIRTFTGKYIDVFEPKIEDICIEDIAHALSLMPRWGGHTKQLYSVAQHSINVCLQAPKDLQLQALLHDASEAYILDMPRPIKKRILTYEILEFNLMKVIAEKFGFDYCISKEVKRIDNLCMKHEWEEIVLDKQKYLGLNCWDSWYAEQTFLSLFKTITNGK